MENLIFGPVPSRRLGSSIGVNNIPHKICTYSCIYCQIGKAVKMQVDRQEFYPVDVIVRELEHKLNSLNPIDFPDYITLVPDGEPTLDIHLGKLLIKLKTFGLPVAVITNSSLFDRKDVQDELMIADYVSMKVDTVNYVFWKKINKPHKDINFSSILQAIQKFSMSFTGKLVTESMLLKNVNDSDEEIEVLAQFLQNIKPDIAYIAIPIRPPAFKSTLPADETSVTMAYDVFKKHDLAAELLTGYEGNAFVSSGNFTDDILSITAVHPMRMDAIQKLMTKSNATEESLDRLVYNGLIKKVNYNNRYYFIRTFGND
jgi:wyosine [tRNA(Phe)-imidazoG37] synthetase (radical SAM superfamily)